jgi:hypothetical protein
MVDIDGLDTRDLIAPLFFNDNTDLHRLIREPILLAHSTPLLLRNMQADFLWLCRKKMVPFTPSGLAALQVSLRTQLQCG